MSVTYSIWRLQIINNFIKYTKINNTVKKNFKSENHKTLKSAEIEANRYINYIQNSSNRILTLHIDQIYIIESSRPVETAHIYQPYYYNMWDLFSNSEHDFCYLQFKPKSNSFFNNLLKFFKIICCF